MSADSSPPLKRRLKYTWLHPRYLASKALRDAVARVAPRASGRLLDVGCGVKPYADLFAPHVTTHFGTDLPTSMHGTHLIDAASTSLALPFADASFDTVLTTEVMEHVPEPARMLAEIARVLRPGGALILTVPFHEPLHEVPYDYYRYTPYALRRLLEANCLCVAEVINRGGSILASSYLLSNFLYRRFGATGYPGELHARPLVGPVVVVICAVVQLLGAALDAVTSDEYDTIGFVVLAHKAADLTEVAPT